MLISSVKPEPLSVQGFTLLEIVFAIVLLGILATLTASYLSGSNDSIRWETTRSRMEAIRTAILGDPKVDSGERTRFGYLGDMGRLPPSLTVLTGSEAPAYVFHTYYGVGAGWRGPYLAREFVGEQGVEKDEWGNSFIYSTTASPPSLTSYGSDGAAGGSAYATDITVTFPASLRLSTVRGVLTDGSTRLSNQVVQIQYPLAGTLTATLDTTAANGAFIFSAVPFGLRAITVTSLSPILGPNRFIVESTETVVPPALTDHAGRTGVSYSSVVAEGIGNARLNATLTSTYLTDKTLDYVTLRWSNATTLSYVQLGADQQVTSTLPSNTRVDVYKTMTLPARSTTTHFYAQMSGNIVGEEFVITFEWTTGERDTITIQL